MILFPALSGNVQSQRSNQSFSTPSPSSTSQGEQAGTCSTFPWANKENSADIGGAK